MVVVVLQTIPRVEKVASTHTDNADVSPRARGALLTLRNTRTSYLYFGDV